MSSVIPPLEHKEVLRQITELTETPPTVRFSPDFDRFYLSLPPTSVGEFPVKYRPSLRLTLWNFDEKTQKLSERALTELPLTESNSTTFVCHIPSEWRLELLAASLHGGYLSLSPNLFYFEVLCPMLNAQQGKPIPVWCNQNTLKRQFSYSAYFLLSEKTAIDCLSRFWWFTPNHESKLWLVAKNNLTLSQST